MSAAPHFLGRADWRLGLGVYRLGSQTEHAVKTALNLGYRHIDTAALYGNEAAVASAIAASGARRADICAATKLHVRDIDRLSIRAATEAALARLGEIDLLMLHAWRPRAPEAWALLAEEAAAGRVRAIGVSNFGAQDLAMLGPPTPVVNQIELSPFLPRPELRSTCAAAGVAVAAHSPLVKGRRFQELREIAWPYSPAQILIAWGLEHAAAAAARSSNAAHLRDNLAAQEIRLNAAQRSALQAAADGYATHPKVLRDGGGVESPQRLASEGDFFIGG